MHLLLSLIFFCLLLFFFCMTSIVIHYYIKINKPRVRIISALWNTKIEEVFKGTNFASSGPLRDLTRFSKLRCANLHSRIVRSILVNRAFRTSSLSKGVINSVKGLLAVPPNNVPLTVPRFWMGMWILSLLSRSYYFNEIKTGWQLNSENMLGKEKILKKTEAFRE